METISVCIPSYNTFSRGQEVLERTINSIANSIKFLYSQKNDVKVIISWVDDASTDGTLDEVKRLRDLQDDIIKDSFFITPIKVNRGQAYCRNLAATLYNSDYISLFDSDDEMYENHLFVCHFLMNFTTDDGQKFAIGSTLLETNEESINPYWLDTIGNSSLSTKIIRRNVWEFIEGIPTDFIYIKTGEEDVAFNIIMDNFFKTTQETIVTFKYWNYPNSNFDKQLEKFRTDPEKYVEKHTKYPEELIPVRNKIITRKIEYLQQKLKVFNLYDKFNDLVKVF